MRGRNRRHGWVGVQPTSTVCRTGSGDVCDPDEFCPGVPVGSSLSDATVDLSVEDLASLGDAEQTARIAAVRDELAVSRSLEKGPAFRARLLTRGAQKHVLVISLPAL
jgi:hypothetical protein